MLDIRLETFITLSKVKSFTKSAEILNITQPAVSQHVKYLEEYYGVKLIKIQGKTMELTAEGKILLKSAEDIELLYRALDMKLRNKSGIIKTYNVGASMTIGGYVLPQILGKYKKLYDNINILLQVNNTEEIVQKMLNGKLDFAIVEGSFDKNKFLYKKFRDDELVLAISPENIFAKEREVEIEDIIRGNLILREKGSGTREIFENRIIELGYSLEDLKGNMEIGSISAIKSMIELNLGYSIISRETIKKEIDMGTIKIAPIKNMHILREFNFIYLEKDMEEFVEEFIKFCGKIY